MVSKSSLRWLIALEIFLMIIGVIVEEQALSSMPFGYRDSGGFVPLLGNSDELTLKELGIGIPMFLLGLAAYVSLISFMRPGRRLYILFHILSLAILPMAGPSTSTGWGGIFDGASITISGIVLAILYFTPLKEYFEKKKTDVPTLFPGTSTIETN